jgi:hypothetical protein
MEQEEQHQEKKPTIKEIVYNFAQLLFILCFQKIKILEWGRGTGKSTILGRDIYDTVVQLPRSTGVMVAETYAQIKTRTLPSTIAGLEQHGIYKDVHYFVGKRPPASWNWPEPYEPPLDYTHCVYFWNGTVMIFISQDGGAASGRGLNVDWIKGDEAARLDEEQFNTDVLLTNRGGNHKIAHYPDGTWKYFKDCPLHHSITLATSTPVTAKGRWILKYEEQAILNPERVAFLRASAEVNRANLGDEYFENAKATMPDFLYKAEVENIRVTQIEDGFYPKLNEAKHCYNNFNHNYYKSLANNSTPDCLGDADLLLNQPLIVGIDWGANINCMVIGQSNGHEFKFLKNIYVKFPKTIDDLVDEFVAYYAGHQHKHMKLWYDPSGNNKQANDRRTFAQQVHERLTSKGWRVDLMTKWNNQESHEIKYKLWINLLSEEDPKYPAIRFNKSNCQELWISMTNAGAKQGIKAVIQKDKSSERKKGFAQEHATHFSDAADILVVGMFQQRMYKSISLPPTQIR